MPVMLEAAPPALVIRRHRARIVFPIICALLLASAIVAVGLGPTHISVADTLRAVVSPFSPSRATDEQTRTIVLSLRMPRILLAIIIGGALAGAGTAFQSLLRNDLAEPYTLGVSSGAALAAGTVIAFGAEGLWAGLFLPTAAFLGALAVLGVVFAIAVRAGRVEIRSLLLAGVIVSAFLWSVQLALFKVAGKSADEVLSWLLGHLQEATWRDDWLVGIVFAIAVVLLAFQGRAMNVLSLGEEQAQQLGIDVHRLKIILILSATLMTAAAVAVTGIIGFVGLIAPHVARRLAQTPDNRIVLPLAVLCGALMTLWSDTVARLALGGDALPVGVITAFLGAPFFAYLLRQEQR